MRRLNPAALMLPRCRSLISTALRPRQLSGQSRQRNRDTPHPNPARIQHPVDSASKATTKSTPAIQGPRRSRFRAQPQGQPRVPRQPAQAGRPEKVIQKTQPNRRGFVKVKATNGFEKSEAQQRRGNKAERQHQHIALRSAKTAVELGLPKNAIQVRNRNQWASSRMTSIREMAKNGQAFKRVFLFYHDCMGLWRRVAAQRRHAAPVKQSPHGCSTRAMRSASTSRSPFAGRSAPTATLPRGSIRPASTSAMWTGSLRIWRRPLHGPRGWEWSCRAAWTRSTWAAEHPACWRRSCWRGCLPPCGRSSTSRRTPRLPSNARRASLPMKPLPRWSPRA